MPWLTGTAFLHSVMIQEKEDMLKVWNMVLVILTFLLTIFGTFLTRSGVISSVHSFTQSGLGPFFLVFLVAGAGRRRSRCSSAACRSLAARAQLESMLSREAAFLFNNLVLVGIAFAVFWGTLFPVISEAVRGMKITVGPPFFNRVNAPLGLLLLVPHRRRAADRLAQARRARNLRGSFAWPVAVGLLAGAGACCVAGMRDYLRADVALAGRRSCWRPSSQEF